MSCLLSEREGEARIDWRGSRDEPTTAGYEGGLYSPCLSHLHQESQMVMQSPGDRELA